LQDYPVSQKERRPLLIFYKFGNLDGPIFIIFFHCQVPKGPMEEA